MSQLDIELEVVRNRLAALEKQKQIEVKKEVEKLESPLKVLEDIIEQKRIRVERNRNSKGIPLARFHSDKDKLAMLEPIFNMLKSIDERLKALEPKI